MQQGGGQNASDQTASFFWYIVLIAVAVLVIWFLGKKYLVPPLFYIRTMEMYVIEYVLKGYNYLATMVHLPIAGVARIQHAVDFMANSNPKKVTIDQVEYVSNVAGYYFRYPVIAVLLVLGYFAAFRHRSGSYVTTYSMKTLKKAEAINWPEITPVKDLDLIKQNINEGPWAMAKLPLDYCKEHDLLVQVVKDGKRIWTISHGAAEKLFVMQMGSMWESVDKLPIHMKALFVICIARSDRDKKTSLGLLKQISLSANSSGQLDFTGVEELAQKYKDHKLLKWVVQRHAYVYTVMSRLLEIARAEGVLATAEFLWLKPYDRRLWYVLNTVGRVTPTIEVAGVYAHLLAEKKLERRLRTPVVSEAVRGLELAIEEILFVGDEEKWRTSNAD